MRGVAIGCVLLGVTAAARADVVEVYVFDFDYSIHAPEDPDVQDAVVRVGDTVRWVFTQSGHSVTSVRGIAEQFDSGYVGISGVRFEHVFTHVGEFVYYCFPHGQDLGDGTASGMVGVVTVLGAECRADWDGSGMVDAGDVAAFLDDFFADGADFDCDLRTDTRDFFAFLSAWFAGC